MWVRESEWHGTVKHFIEESQFTLLRAARTASLGWELKQAIECNPTKLLIWVPGRAKSYREFTRWANDILPVPLPEEPQEFIMFAKDGTPRGLGRSEHFTHEREKAILSTLKPFLERVGYEPEREQVRQRILSRLTPRARLGVGLAIVGVLVLLLALQRSLAPPPCTVTKALVGQWNFTTKSMNHYSMRLGDDGNFSIKYDYSYLPESASILVARGKWCQAEDKIQLEDLTWLVSEDLTPLSKYERTGHASMIVLSQTAESLELKTTTDIIFSLQRSERRPQSRP